ncbi:hypothetical protein ACLOJK_010420 [Asimina triloba]
MLQQQLSPRIRVFARSFALYLLELPRISSSSRRLSSTSFSLQNRLLQQRPALPGDFLKWVSFGYSRGSRFATGFTPLEPKPLDSIIDVERANKCSPEELVSVWNDVSSDTYPLSAYISFENDVSFGKRSHSQYFVIPLWRGSGYTTMFIQGSISDYFHAILMPHILFTGLEDYKARGTQAAPYLTVTYYKEYAESKDVVLIRGDIVFTSKLSDSEAGWLLETTQSIYLNDTRYKLVESFNKDTREFEFKDLLQALEMPME